MTPQEQVLITASKKYVFAAFQRGFSNGEMSVQLKYNGIPHIMGNAKGKPLVTNVPHNVINTDFLCHLNGSIRKRLTL